MAHSLDEFLPNPDVRDRHEIVIRAPADLVMQTARSFDIQSIRSIRAIFWLRARLLGAKAAPLPPSSGFVNDMLSIGWRSLADDSSLFVAGAVCRPWIPDVVFHGVPREEFAEWHEPDWVKIVWTLEPAALEPALTRFATETRASATDDQARAKFRRYWRMFGIGIVLIRKLLLPAIRRQAEKQWRAMQSR